ncbi:MAG: glutaredoxin family protein [Xanthomonadales bacterium]|nr:glutaredoxin family protein [Xanthomonadales bacterium]
MKLLVYSRPECHLCDLAAAELKAAGLLEFVKGVNIEDDPELLKRYELTIPVVHNPATQVELGWPFTAQSLRKHFLAPE